MLLAADTADQSANRDSVKILESFAAQTEQRTDDAMTLKQRHTIMFLMGVPLLLLLLTTFSLGLAMALFNKKVFVWHMIAAGLTLTLALAHTVVGLVWFYPF